MIVHCTMLVALFASMLMVQHTARAASTWISINGGSSKNDAAPQSDTWIPWFPRLQLKLKHEKRMMGTFYHSHGYLEFESTPSNFSVNIADKVGEVKDLMSCSRHCLPGTAPCLDHPEINQYLILATAPSTKIVQIRGTTFKLPPDLDVRSKRAVDAFFRKFQRRCAVKDTPANDIYWCMPWSLELSRIDENDEHAAIERFYIDYADDLRGLTELYGAMYGKHSITGHSLPSAIPLYMMALTHSSWKADDARKLSAVHELLVHSPTNPDDADDTYDAFRGAMSPMAESGRRSLQSFSTNSNINFCMDHVSKRTALILYIFSAVFKQWPQGYINSYTTSWNGWNNNCCGDPCQTRPGHCGGTCGRYSPNCGGECAGMCGPGCDSCWPGQYAT